MSVKQTVKLLVIVGVAGCLISLVGKVARFTQQSHWSGSDYHQCWNSVLFFLHGYRFFKMYFLSVAYSRVLRGMLLFLVLVLHHEVIGSLCVGLSVLCYFDGRCRHYRCMACLENLDVWLYVVAILFHHFTMFFCCSLCKCLPVSSCCCSFAYRLQSV